MKHTYLFVAAVIGGLPVASAQMEAQTDAQSAGAAHAGGVLPERSPASIVHDDLTRVTPAWQARQALEHLRRAAASDDASTGATEAGSAVAPRPYPGHLPPKDEAAHETFSRQSVESLLTTPLFQESDGDRAIWTRVRRMKASFSPEGFTAYPAFGKAATESYSAHFDLRAVTLDGEEVPYSRTASISRNGDSVTLDRDSVREVYHVSLDGIEQTFVFDGLPAVGGDLSLDVRVDSNLDVHQDATGIHFLHPSLGGLTYGDAFVLDAKGRRESIEREWTGESIVLKVPAAFLADATFPLTIDPPVTSFTSTAGTPDDSEPDVCFTGGSGLYWTVFQDYVTGTQNDAYAVSFDTSGAVVNFISVDLSQDDWTTPKIAYHVGSDRCLVVASVVDTGGNGTIQGQLIDCATAFLEGTAFTISTVGALKVHPDVGGNNFDSLTNSHFLVAWSTIWTPGASHQIEYRTIDWDGSPVTAVTQVTTFGEVHNEPSISATHGDADLFGDWWTLVWTHDADNNGLGDIMARRVVWSGSTGAGAGNFLVASGGNAAHPRVTSRFNRELQHINDRPSIVAYERQFSTASGTPPTQRSIYTKVITDGAAEVESPVSWQLEDFDLELDQRDVDIACDGNCFYMIYTEVYYANPAGTDYDMYMLSGCITDRLDGAEVALAERHQLLAFNSTAERNGSVATVWDGSANSISDDGMAIWEDRNVTNGATLEGSTLEIPTANQSIVRAVGRQFCDANPNSGGGQLGRQSSWSWLQGDQSISTQHIFRATDLPVNSFGYAIIGMTFADINNPAGSLGRVCVPGGGRYVDQIASSGALGALATIITPTNVPTPTGFISMQVGETWGFQYWHRDVTPGGLPSSNFSTACMMQFTN